MVDITLGQAKPKAWATLVTKPSYVAGEPLFSSAPVKALHQNSRHDMARWGTLYSFDEAFQRDDKGVQRE